MIRRGLALAALAAPLALAGCGGAPPQTFAPLNYSYLPTITLNVAEVNVVNSYALSPAEQQLASQNPEPPATVLTAELTRRLIPGGAPGTATVTIENAAIDQTDGNLVGAMDVRIDIASGDGTRTGFTEASVQHSDPAPDDDQLQAGLYNMTKELMDAINVQLQYQVQANLPSWIVAGAGAAPALGGPALGRPAPVTSTIEAAPLPPPTVVPGAPGSGAPVAIPAPTAPTSVPPSQTLTLPPSAMPAAPVAPATGLAPPQQLVPY